jgi:hypothetical protein
MEQLTGFLYFPVMTYKGDEQSRVDEDGSS